MFISAINNCQRTSFGHIYSNTVDTVLQAPEQLKKKQEAKLYDMVSRASKLNKSVITSSTSKGLVLLTANDCGTRNIYKTYKTSHDLKTNLEQLETAVKDAEALEETSLPKINPLKAGITRNEAIGRPERHNTGYTYIYNQTLNGYNSDF
jgi:hypothetical protein